MTMRVLGRDGQKELEIDKRTLPDKVPNNMKDLAEARDLPIKCNDCKYRPREEMGNGICTEYKKDSLCSIRAKNRKIIAEYSTRNEGQIIPLMEEEFESNFEKLKFFEQLEIMSGELIPEVSKRINVLNNLGKTLAELKSKKTIIEMSETKSLSPEKKDEISKMLKVTQQEIKA